MMTTSRSILLLLLLIFAVVALAGNHHRHARHRRNHDLHDWLTEEQKNELKNIDKKTPEFKKKVGEFYSALSDEKRAEWDKFYKKHCFEWTGKVQNEDEEKAFKELLKNRDVEGTRTRISELKIKLGDEDKKSVEMWEEDCLKLIERTSRKRRELDPAFADFIKWMTPEQKTTIGEFKTAGKSENEIRDKVKEFFGALPADKQTELRGGFKDKCGVYFKPLLTDDESEKIKTLTGDKTAIQELVKGAVNRQEGANKAVAEKMFNICGEVYNEASRKRRELDPAFNDFVKWLTPEQKTEIGEFKKSGKSDEEVRDKMKEYFGLLSADKQTEVREELKGKCKVYFAPLLTAEETEKVKGLVASKDKEATATLFKEVVNRQEGSTKTIAEKMYNVCGEVYKQESRKRRDISSTFKDFIKWMTPEQQTEIGELKAAGKADEVIRDKTREFFRALPADKQNELKSDFKGKCRVYFKPLMTDEESEKIKTLTGDKEAIGALIKGVVNRQEGSNKEVATTMFDICGEVYKDASRKRRELDPAFDDFVKWLTPEQKTEIGEFKKSGKSDEEIRGKMKEYFGLLSADKQTEVKEDLKGKCKVYFAPLLTAEESEKVKGLVASGDKESTATLFKGVVNRQEGEKKTIAEKMYNVCGEVYRHSSRKRRELDPTVKEFVKWLTPEQATEIGELKKSGKSDDEIRGKLKEFFDLLSADKQTEVREELKGKCKVYFSPLFIGDESENLKKLVAAGDKEAATNIVKGVVNRQEGDKKAIAEKMFNVCGEVYKQSKKMRRDVRSKIEKHLAWLNPEEKDEIVKMTSDGVSKEEIRKKLFTFVENHEKDSTQKEKSIKRCYQWMDEVATKQEIESLHSLHHVDHAACKKKVREFISRLPEEKQTAVEASLPFCEKLWYGDHAEHQGHDHSHHHHRMRRHFVVIEKFLSWMDESQKNTIKEMENSGAEFNTISDKIQEFFKLLPSETQDELKSGFKNQCMIWAKEVAKPGEWESIKKHYAAKDFGELKLLLVELEGRLTENQKHTIEHVRGVCYKLWDIKGISRLRRVPHTSRSRREWDNIGELVGEYLEMRNSNL